MGVEKSAIAAVSMMGSGKRIDAKELASKQFDAGLLDEGIENDV
jgi:hypothetical protein